MLGPRVRGWTTILVASYQITSFYYYLFSFLCSSVSMPILSSIAAILFLYPLLQCRVCLLNSRLRVLLSTLSFCLQCWSSRTKPLDSSLAYFPAFSFWLSCLSVLLQDAPNRISYLHSKSGTPFNSLTAGHKPAFSSFHSYAWVYIVFFNWGLLAIKLVFPAPPHLLSWTTARHPY